MSTRRYLNLRIPLPNGLGWLRRLLPTPGNVLFTLVMIALLVAAQTAGALPLGEHRGVAPTAASTGTIAYQGRLADAAGAPLTGTYNMIFRLYAAATGGTSLWSEPWTGSNGVRVSDGLFNVMLGSLAQLPIAQFTNSPSLFLGITVGTDDEMAPRVQLGSVPFAVQALTVPDGSVTTGKIADGAVTSQKQTSVSFSEIDNSSVQTVGTSSTVVSEFSFPDLPKGDVAVSCSFLASIPSESNNYASVVLTALPGGELSVMPGHIMTYAWGQYVLQGRLANFAGGPLSVQIVVTGERVDTRLAFGAPNTDGRFGRKCTVIAGI